MPMAARRRKVHSTPFPPSGENCVRSLAPPLPGEPASLGFAGSNEGLGKAPPGTAPDEHFVLIVAFPRTPFTGVTPWVGQNISGAQNLSGVPPFNPGHWALGVQKFQSVRFQFCACLIRTNVPGANPGGRPKGLPYPVLECFLRTVGEGTTPLIKGRCRAQRDRVDRELPLPPFLERVLCSP